MSGANREDAMVITVMRDGTVYFVRDRVVPYQLHSKILDRLKDRTSESRVYIRADVRGTVRVKEVLDGVRSAGIEQVAFLVDQRRPPMAGR
ncbi:MAG: biopolymer transporter ExbD [Candidatus Sulfotelmatobacter sp.]